MYSQTHREEWSVCTHRQRQEWSICTHKQTGVVSVYSLTDRQNGIQILSLSRLSLEQSAGAAGDGDVTGIQLQRRVVGVLCRQPTVIVVINFMTIRRRLRPQTSSSLPRPPTNSGYLSARKIPYMLSILFLRSFLNVPINPFTAMVSLKNSQ